MLRLVAAAWKDGYAAVQDGDQIYLIRPPYQRRNKHRVRAAQVERAVAQHGFTSTDISFEDWAGLIEHLTARFLESRKQSGQPDGERIRRAVERAPAPVVSKYLQKVEQEMFPVGEWHAAFALLTYLLRNPVVKSDAAIVEQIADLLRHAEDRRNLGDLESAGVAELLQPLEEEFPLVDGEAARLARHVQREGQVLYMGARAVAS